MTYQEFRKTYKWMLSKYPGTDSVFCVDMDAIIGTCETVNFAKIGGKWKETGRKIENLTPAFYSNSVDAIPFFKAFGGRERVELAYTKIAYLPVCIHSTSPDKTLKTVRTFKFN